MQQERRRRWRARAGGAGLPERHARARHRDHDLGTRAHRGADARSQVGRGRPPARPLPCRLPCCGVTRCVLPACGGRWQVQPLCERGGGAVAGGVRGLGRGRHPERRAERAHRRTRHLRPRHPHRHLVGTRERKQERAPLGGSPLGGRGRGVWPDATRPPHGISGASRRGCGRRCPPSTATRPASARTARSSSSAAGTAGRQDTRTHARTTLLGLHGLRKGLRRVTLPTIAHVLVRPVYGETADQDQSMPVAGPQRRGDRPDSLPLSIPTKMAGETRTAATTEGAVVCDTHWVGRVCMKGGGAHYREPVVSYCSSKPCREPSQASPVLRLQAFVYLSAQPLFLMVVTAARAVCPNKGLP
jgi:hypothetical protein